jgi:type IV pilus assembly protein PilA
MSVKNIKKSYSLLSKNGFTLIELIVVLAVLSILALIAIPRYTPITQTAQQAQDKANAIIVYKSWLSHEISNNGSDPTLDQLNKYLGGLVLTELPTNTQNGDGFITSLTYNGITIP